MLHIQTNLMINCEQKDLTQGEPMVTDLQSRQIDFPLVALRASGSAG